MSANLEKICDDYREADFTGRLHIYLQFPELRNDFLEIDQKELKTDFFQTAEPLANGCCPLRRLIHKKVTSFLGWA